MTTESYKGSLSIYETFAGLGFQLRVSRISFIENVFWATRNRNPKVRRRTYIGESEAGVPCRLCGQWSVRPILRPGLDPQ